MLAVTSSRALNPSTVSPACPTCGAPLVSEHGAAPWCERCAWGIDRYDPPKGTSWWRRRTGAVSFRIAYRLTMGQFRELASGTKERGRQLASGTKEYAAGIFGAAAPVSGAVGEIRAPRGWGRARLVAVVVAVLLYAFLAYLAYLGVRLVLFDFPNLTLILGVLLLLVVVYLLPRFPRLSRNAEILTRAEAPALYATVDRVAEAVGTAAPRTIVVSSVFNASTTAVGIRRRRVLHLGLGLFGALDPQQRIALLAHEMGHFRHGDIRRGLVIYPAMSSLGRIADLFTGETLVRFRPGGWANEGALLNAVIEPIVNLIMGIVSGVFYGAHLGVLAVMLRDSQRREYLCDQRSAQLAGTRATTGMLDLLVADTHVAVAARARAQQLQDGWQEAAAGALAPEQAPRLRRLRQLSTRREVSLWRTHPPAGLRAWLVEAEAYRDPTLVLTPAESQQIDTELARYYQRARRDLAQSGV